MEEDHKLNEYIYGDQINRELASSMSFLGNYFSLAGLALPLS